MADAIETVTGASSGAERSQHLLDRGGGDGMQLVRALSSFDKVPFKQTKGVILRVPARL